MTSIEYVPIDEVAKKLNVCPATVRGWVRKGIVPGNTYIKVGKTYRFHINSVVNALQQQEQGLEPVVEADSEDTDDLDDDI